mgnify:CR=1 FL=1
MKHNKKRNTAFLYEVLIKELSKASMHGIQEKKNKVLDLLKKFFSKGTPLREELEIYASFTNIQGQSANTIEKIISEARSQAEKLNYSDVDKTKTRLINLINKDLGPQSWENFIKNYKHMATVNQVVFSKSSPKKQIFLQEKLVKLMTEGSAGKKQFPSINKLTLKTFLEKFNDQYGKTLNENQKKLLNKYITSYDDEGLELKAFLYEEIDRIRGVIEESVRRKNEKQPKFKLILEKIQDYSKRKIDRKMISEIIKIQSLVEEMNNGTNT